MALNLDGIGKKLGPVTRQYSWRELVLYALGVGAGYDELDFVYENRLQVLPSFAILSIYDFFSEFMATSGVNLMGIVHGEHELILHTPVEQIGVPWVTAHLVPHAPQLFTSVLLFVSQPSV